MDKKTKQDLDSNSYKPSQRKSAFIETIHGADNGGDLIADFTNIGYMNVLQTTITLTTLFFLLLALVHVFPN